MGPPSTSALRATARLLADGHDVEYRLAGGGDARLLIAAARRLGVTDRIRFDGAVPHHHVFDWLDEIDISVVDGASAISQIQAGAIDFYSFTLASDQFPAIEDAGLPYAKSVGGYYGFSFNPAVFDDTTRLNPFSNRKIREATNWLIDREYLNQEIYAGGSLPKLLPITTQLAEYTNLIDTARALESEYAYNPDRAKEVIDAEMPGMGAELGADGKWQFNGEPVTLAFMIRPDGDGTRKPMGDYFANQLETVGFTVDRQYKTSSEAFAIWLDTPAQDGQWSLYTAGYSPSGLGTLRDESANIQQSYLNTRVQAGEPYISNVSDPEFQKLGDDLAKGVYVEKEARDAAMRRALELSLEDSLFVWTIEQQVYSPYSDKVQVAYDLATGYEGTNVGPYNLRLKDQEGGTLKIGTNDLFSQPWNTIAGSSGVWDVGVMHATTMGTSNYVGGGGWMSPWSNWNVKASIPNCCSPSTPAPRAVWYRPTSSRQAPRQRRWRISSCRRCVSR